MIYRFLLALALCSAAVHAQVDFTGRVVAERLNIPWDMLQGPDGKIWFTERVGLVSRIDPDTRKIDTLLDMRKGILQLVEVGLLSMVLHPDFADTPYVYLSYVYRDTYDWVKHVSRFRFNGTAFVDEQVLYELRPAELWHQGCRMVVLPDRTLMFTNGDQPAPDSTYSPTSEIGKILRINLDGSIPTDNPYPNNRVWSRGHRNPQGLCVLPNGLVFSSEHGNNIEDEINLIRKDGNYGWPKVEGMCDTPEEQVFCQANNVIEPVWSSGYVQTYAPAGLEYYGHDRYPSLTGKLLSTHLKSSRIMAHTLSDDQQRITDTKYYIEYRYGRIRDVLVMKDGRVFVCTGNSGYKNIEPFPKAADDQIIELLPVWQYEQPSVKAQFDTIIYRTNVGDTVRAFVPFCGTTSATVDFLDFQTNPGNTFQQRHWQDAATTEGTSCWPFKVLYVPDSSYPHVARATAWFDDRNGKRDSVSTVLIGLPYKGLALSAQDRYTASSTTDTCQFIVELTNIGDTSVTISSCVATPDILATHSASTFPLTIAPQQSASLTLRIDSTHGQQREAIVRFTTNGLRDPIVTLNTNFIRDTVRISGDITIAPFPVTDLLVLRNVPAGTADVHIYDVHGRKVYSSSVVSNGTIQIPTKDFVATADGYGSYAVELYCQGGIQRFVIMTTQ
jgi:glucose/arabinose dehydrogenase